METIKFVIPAEYLLEIFVFLVAVVVVAQLLVRRMTKPKTDQRATSEPPEIFRVPPPHPPDSRQCPKCGVWNDRSRADCTACHTALS